jgi:hypothetical protein
VETRTFSTPGGSRTYRTIELCSPFCRYRQQGTIMVIHQSQGTYHRCLLYNEPLRPGPYSEMARRLSCCTYNDLFNTPDRYTAIEPPED